MSTVVPPHAVKLSVCIPTHHGRRALLEQTLASVAAAARADVGVAVEVVVSDNASADGTAEMVAAFAAQHPSLEVVYRRNELDVRLQNIFLAVERASGDWCWLFGSDDVMTDDGLAVVAATIRAFPQAAGIAVGRVDFDHDLRERLTGMPDAVLPDAAAVTELRSFAAIEDQLLFHHAFLGSNVVRRDAWLAAAREHASAAVDRHPDWPQLIVLAAMARREPVWVWQPTVVVKARGGRSYLVEGDGPGPNFARMHVKLVGGLHRALAELAAGDRTLYRRLMRRAHAVAGSADTVHNIKLAPPGHGARWGVRLALTLTAAFWWDRTFLRGTLWRAWLPRGLYAKVVARRAAAGRPMEELAADAGAVRVVAVGGLGAWPARRVVHLRCRVRNVGPVALTSLGERPVHVGARWLASPEAAGPRVRLERPLAPGAETEVVVPVVLPWEPGPQRLAVGCVQEHVRWFGDADPANDLILDVDVRLPASPEVAPCATSR